MSRGCVLSRLLTLLAFTSIIMTPGCMMGWINKPSTYRSNDRLFEIVLPHGWQEDPPLSKELTKQARKEDKDAVAALIRSNKKVDPFGLNLMIAFLPADPNYQDSFQRQKYIEKLKKKFGGALTDKIYLARDTTISGQPAIQLAICTAYEGLHGRTCNMVHHITEVFAQHSRIRIQFNVAKELYPKFQEKIEGSLASIKVVTQ